MKRTLCAVVLMFSSGAAMSAGYDASVDLQPQFEEINKTFHEQRNDIRRRFNKPPIKYEASPKWNWANKMRPTVERGETVGVDWKDVKRNGDNVRLVGMDSRGQRVEASFRRSDAFVTGDGIEVDGKDHYGNSVKIEIDSLGNGTVRGW